MDPYFLDLGTSWKRVISFTLRPSYPLGKSLRYPLDRRLCEPQIRSGRLEKRKFLTLPGLELLPLSRPARSQSLYRLRYPGSDRGLLYCPNVRFFNNMLCTLDERPSIFTRGKRIFSSERMLHKDYDRKGLVETNCGRESQRVCRQDELIGGKPVVVKSL
jgi:hypothetical protein